MPASAARSAGADLVAGAEKLGVEVVRFVRERIPTWPGEPAPALMEEAQVDEDRPDAVLGAPMGPPSGFVCPDCSGALFVVAEQPVLRFRCRIGHGWTAESLVAQHDVTVETALWMAVRTLKEKAELAERLARRAEDEAREASANRFHESAREADASARILRDLLSAMPVDGRIPDAVDAS